MLLSNNKYNIVRVGDFATRANTKINYCLFSIGLCLDDYIMNNSIDCFIILSYSTIIWTFIEFILHISNTRNIKPMIYYYSKDDSQVVPYYIGLFLQGFQEGGCITTIGLYFGDRLFSFYHVIFLHIVIIFIVINVCNKTKTTKRNSIRQVNTSGSLITMSSVTLCNIKSLYEHQQHVYRQLSMFFVMIYVSSWWTFFVWYKGFRTVDVYIKDHHDQYIVQKYNLYDTVKVLSYDIIFEIAMAYLFFYRFLIYE